MMSSDSSCWLLGQASNWRRMGDQFSGRGADLSTGELFLVVAVFAGAGLLLWLLHWAANRHEQRLRKPNAAGLFRELCRSHSVSRMDRTTLRLLAEAAQLDQPAEIFLRPDLFERENLPPAMRGDAKAVTAIGNLLFSDLQTSPAYDHDKAEQQLVEA